MKPKTKLQRRVIELSKWLPNIDGKMLSWAKSDCLQHKGYATKNRVVCMDCGKRFASDIVVRKRAVCPHCNTKLKIEQSRKTTDKQCIYVAIAQTYEEFQIIRNFEIETHYKADEEPKYFIWEILQHWILPSGKHEIVARNRTVNWYVNSWNGDMEIRKNTSRKKYDIYPEKMHPDSVFMPSVKLHGINHRLRGLTPFEAITFIPKNPKAETLLKAKQYQLLGYCYDYNGGINRRWPSVKICMRNKYIVKDAKLWVDYLDLLAYFHKDLHNAYYVCPANLKKEHDRLVAKKREIQKREEAERKRKKALEDEKEFQELKSKFFGIQFTDGLIQVKVLESVEEFMKEGDTMHHCLFTNEYYLKPDSLILSAKIEDKPIETVEVSLKKMKVVQSRGVCNGNTEYHDRIIKLVNRNMRAIRKRVTA